MSEERYIPLPQPELGKKLRDARKAHKYSQRQVGEVIGVSYQTIAYWEKANRTASVDRLTALALAFGLPPTYFLRPVSIDLAPPIPNKLSRRLRAYRHGVGMTQGELSQKSGVSLVLIKSYEDDNSGLLITRDNAVAISAALGLESAKDLLGDNMTLEEEQEAISKYYCNKLQECLRRLSPKGLEEAVKRIEEMTLVPYYQK